MRSFILDDEKEDHKLVDENNFVMLKKNPELCKLVKSLLHRSWDHSKKPAKVT